VFRKNNNCVPLFASVLVFCAVSLQGAERYRASEPQMGSIATITLYADSPEQAQQAFIKAFARITELNGVLSDYDPNSELSRICESARRPGKDLSSILSFSAKLASETEGAFDLTIGPLTRLWRQARKERRIPTLAEVDGALERVGYTKLEGSRCTVAGMQLDAGGIAKGYAADEALAVLKSLGISRALVAMSGDIVSGDPPPGKDGWNVMVADQVRLLRNEAVSTSGDEFQHHEVQGVRYSHIIDPRTGWALRNSRSIAVIAKTGMETDAIATAVSVGGPDTARKLTQRGGITIIFR
jgi:thiamine biosynthesis lipoprotein